jgi:hypothetical protein
MRGRASRTLLTLAAGVTLTALSPATAGPVSAAHAGHAAFNPSGGAPVAVLRQAGYVASGRGFRYVQALIRIPDQPCLPGMPSFYVALDDAGNASRDYTRVGIMCESDIAGARRGADRAGRFGHVPNAWNAFLSLAVPGLPNPVLETFPLSDVSPGDGVFVSLYLDPTHTDVHAVVTLPGGTTFTRSLVVQGPVYTGAAALADWSGSVPDTPAPPAARYRLTQFLQGRFTTLSGQHGTFSGPWTLNACEVTSNGLLPPSGTLVFQPSYLWTDASSFRGRFGDAFGIWGFPF